MHTITLEQLRNYRKNFYSRTSNTKASGNTEFEITHQTIRDAISEWDLRRRNGELREALACHDPAWAELLIPHTALPVRYALIERIITNARTLTYSQNEEEKELAMESLKMAMQVDDEYWALSEMLKEDRIEVGKKAAATRKKNQELVG